MPRLLLSALLFTLTLAGCGCGGGGGGGPGGPTTSEASTGTGAQPSTTPRQRPPSRVSGRPAGGAARFEPRPSTRAFQPRPHHDSGGGSEQFILKGGDNSVQEFGAEASSADLEQAAAALHDFLDARAERNWAAACTYLGKAAKRGLPHSSAPSRPPSCAATLATLSAKVPTATLREAAVANVGSLRREGQNGFLIYRGAPKGTVYAISVVEEGGAWKVASLAATPLN